MKRYNTYKRNPKWLNPRQIKKMKRDVEVHAIIEDETELGYYKVSPEDMKHVHRQLKKQIRNKIITSHDMFLPQPNHAQPRIAYNSNPR